MKSIAGFVVVISLLLLPLAAHAKKAKAKAPPPAVKLQLEDARRRALVRVPGKVEHEELEKEHDRWIYSFEIRADGERDPHVIQEVNVDADTGAIVAVETEHDRALVYPAVPSPAPPRGDDSQASNCALGATTGMPSVVVPMGVAGDDATLPLGLEILARSWDDSFVLSLAYAYERATHHRAPPAPLAFRLASR